MPMPSAGVSGLAVVLTTAGSVLLVAAIRNQKPLDVGRAVLKQPTTGEALGPAFSSVASGVTRAAVGASVGATVGQIASTITAGNGALVAEARKHLGARYVFGATGPDTFDCSGLVVYCLRKTLIPKCKRFTTATVSNYLRGQGWTRISPAQFQSGDVIIRGGHMGIAVSNDRMIHAPHAGTVVKEASIFSKSQWWGYRPPSGASAKANQVANSIGTGN